MIARSGGVVIGIDLGTTGVKVIALDLHGRGVLSSASREYPTSVTLERGHEQDPADWWTAVAACCREVVEEIGAKRIEAVGLSGHMHSLLLLGADLQPVRPAMTWADRRVGQYTARLRADPRFVERAANGVVDAFTAPKLAWLADNEASSLDRARHLILAKDFIALQLTGEVATDVTDAMGTLLWNMTTASWDDELFALCGASSTIAPPVTSSTAIRGRVTADAARATGLPVGVAVIAGAGDVSSVVLGTGVIDSSAICLNAGTAAQAMGITTRVDAGNGFIFGNALGEGYVAMASVYAAGASVRWAERTLFAARPIEPIAEESLPGSRGLSYLPFMFGAVVPRKNDAARAAFIGQTEAHTPADLASAVLEGVAFACADAIDAVAKVTNRPRSVHLVGGVAQSRLWRGALASVLDADVVRLPDGGSTFGAAVLGAVGAGLSTAAEAVAALVAEPVEPVAEASKSAYREARERFNAARDLLV